MSEDVMQKEVLKALSKGAGKSCGLTARDLKRNSEIQLTSSGLEFVAFRRVVLVPSVHSGKGIPVFNQWADKYLLRDDGTIERVAIGVMKFRVNWKLLISDQFCCLRARGLLVNAPLESLVEFFAFLRSLDWDSVFKRVKDVRSESQYKRFIDKLIPELAIHMISHCIRVPYTCH